MGTVVVSWLALWVGYLAASHKVYKLHTGGILCGGHGVLAAGLHRYSQEYNYVQQFPG